jgi:hypothetical protein
VELTDGGGLHSCDARWPVEEWADDGDTWGKTTTRSWGLATSKELANGGAKRRLAGGEWWVVSHLGIEEINGERGSFD